MKKEDPAPYEIFGMIDETTPQPNRPEYRQITHDFIRDPELMEKVKSDFYAAKLYAAWTNMTWVHKESGKEWHNSFRGASGDIADLRPYHEDYMSFYCSRPEGVVEPDIEEDMNRIGWFSKERD